MEDVISRPFFIITLSAGIVFMLSSLIMFRFPSKRINFFYGYRTLQSIRSQQAWRFAQQLAARKMLTAGLTSAGLSLLILPTPHFNPFTEAMSASVIILLLILWFKISIAVTLRKKSINQDKK